MELPRAHVAPGARPERGGRPREPQGRGSPGPEPPPPATGRALLTLAMRTPHHLACVSGPDIGAVVPLPVGVDALIGREGSPALVDARASRVHARVRGLASAPSRGGLGGGVVAEATDLSSTNGLRVRRRRTSAPLSRRIHRGATEALREGDALLLGADVFEVRPRPHDVQWPRPPGAAPRLPVRGLVGLPVALLGASLLWRSGAAVPAGVWAVVAAVGLLVLLGVVALRAGRRRSRWARTDAARLALVTCAPGPAPARAEVMVWTGRAGASARGPTPGGRAVGRDSALHGSAGTRVLRIRLPTGDGSAGSAPVRVTPGAAPEGPSVCAPAALGDEAPLAVRWWATQIAQAVGGVTLVCENGELRRIGHGGLAIHLVSGETCPACAGGASARDGQRAPSGEVVHLGVGRTMQDVPPWSDHVVVCRSLPVSWTWWGQVSEPDVAQQDVLPEVVRPEDLDAGAPGGLSVPLGLASAGTVFLDLVADGPHALVAGTTGSGKSEALTTWLLGMCRAHPPEEVRLVLIDYKGGATFAPLAALPHCEAVLTDLDADATERALRGLGALLRAREGDLGRLGLPDWARWRASHEDGAAPPPPPRVVIAVDEFRVLADTHPGMLDTLVRLAAQGRSLGLHLVLATQRPAGAVSAAMRANIEARLALRCADGADSLDVIGSPGAAELPRIPGRALLRDGTEFQVAWIEDVAAAVDEVRAAHSGCPGSGPPGQGPPLWAPPLPRELSWEEVDGLADRLRAHRSGQAEAHAGEEERPGSTPHPTVALGIVDGIDTGTHVPWVWDGGNVLVEGPQREADDLSRVALAVGARIAAAHGCALHVCSASTRPPAHRGTWVSPLDAGSSAHLLDEVGSHGPCVVVVDDLGGLLEGLENGLGGVAASHLFGRFVSTSRADRVVLVVAAPASHRAPGGLAGAFSRRMVRIHSAEDSLRLGMGTGARRTSPPGRFVTLDAEGGVTVVQTPLAGNTGWTPAGPEASWRVEPLPHATVRPEAAGRVADTEGPRLLLAGARLSPLSCGVRAPWFVIGIDEGGARAAVSDLHERHGWMEPPDCVVVPANRWMDVLQHPTHHVLAFGPLPELLRVLSSRALTVDPATRVAPVSSLVGVALHDGHLERVIVSPGGSPRS